jgi:hypothetical protein
LHDVSYGIIDIANRIYLAAQIRAIEKGTEEITEGLLRSAYRDDFRLVSHIIETLKTGDTSLLHKIRDVCPPPILPIKEDIANLSDTSASTDQQSKTPQCDRDLHSDNPAPVAAPLSKKTSRKSKAISNNFEEKDLRGVVARGHALTPQTDAYRSLLSAGYIKDSTEFLPKN